MSRIDKIFGKTTGRLVRKFGSDMVFIRSAEANYDVDTGDVGAEVARIALKGIITPIKPEEASALTQETDVKIVPDPDEIGDEPIRVDDLFEYTENGGTVTARVVDAKQFRGDSAIAYIVMARPQ